MICVGQPKFKYLPPPAVFDAFIDAIQNGDTISPGNMLLPAGIDDFVGIKPIIFKLTL
jgi:hypothetical protein